MALQTLNRLERTAAAVHREKHRLPGITHKDGHSVFDPGWQQGALPSSDAEALYHALATSEQQLGAALRAIDELRTQETLLKEKVESMSESAKQVRQFAYHDELTGLPNRRLLLDRFNQAIARAARQHTQVALLFLDLNDFKAINDALGHVAGDSLLKQVAQRLLMCIRSSDTVCRFGGDEFVILLPELEAHGGAATAAGKIRAHLAPPFHIGGAAIEVAASIGMAVYPAEGSGFQELLRLSDLAMYRDKARGPARPNLGCNGTCVQLTHC